ncbi:hypothetical protein F5B22DRAFT_605694 [Xylaria bambusicola]|uniref:uncharacterized protein n=1 Tax=Xylaria bambusicola TaxID=326684 RepID=UPI002007504F|nr:uncharacterized protein F5B22DRAFT_605694 [Xylaria bambusicola]KAI0516962.1 hypothetical protein F5B22DRAFT_605694 [Xylaria bambusicola]
MIVILTVICLFLELIIVTFIVWLLWYTCFRQWYQRRRSRRNPERQRAEELLNSPPRPIDLELGVIHARSPPNWPLTDTVPLQSATPSNYDKEDRHVQLRTSLSYEKYSNYTPSTLSEASSLSVHVDSLDITDIQDTGEMQVLEFNSDDSNPDLEVMQSIADFIKDGETESDITNNMIDQRRSSAIPVVSETESDNTHSELFNPRIDNGEIPNIETPKDGTEDETSVRDGHVKQDSACHAH